MRVRKYAKTSNAAEGFSKQVTFKTTLLAKFRLISWKIKDFIETEHIYQLLITFVRLSSQFGRQNQLAEN